MIPVESLEDQALLKQKYTQRPLILSALIGIFVAPKGY